MTDLATQPQAGEASGDDAVEAEQAVENEASATADDVETDAATDAETVTADSGAPADETADEADVEATVAQNETAAETGETVETSYNAAAEDAEAPEAEPAADSAEAADAAEADDADLVEGVTEPETDVEPAAEVGDEPAAQDEPDAAIEDAAVGADTDAVEADSVEELPAEAHVQQESIYEPVAAAEDAAEPEPESVAEADLESEAEPDAEAESVDAAEPEADAKAEPDADFEAEPPAEVEPQPQPESVDAIEGETEVDAAFEAEAETRLEDSPADDRPVDAGVPTELDVATPVAPDPDADADAIATAVLVPSAAAAALAPTATAPAAEHGHAAATATATLPADGSAYAWAPAEAKPKKKHTAVWISAAAGVAVVGLVACSLILIAPGTAVAGVPVGWMTPGAAADAIEQHLAETTVVLTGTGGDAEVTGAELGAAVDANALADAAFAEHPMWNPTAWFAANDAEIELDPAVASQALRDAAPALYTDPVDATLAFDPATATYVVTPAVPGTGVDVATVQAAIQAAFEAGETRVELEPVEAAVAAGISTETADATVARLNGMLDTVGFYVGDERTVPVDRAVAASWLTVTPTDDAFTITADAAAIQPVVDTLAGSVDRAPENAVVITDTGGKVLQTIAGGQSGRQVGDTAGIAAAFATQLGSGEAAYKLPVEEVPVTTTTLARNIVVDLSEQRTYIYENGQLVNSFLISSGTAATPTHTGSFRINSHVREQDMGALCYNPNAVNSYCTKDVPWVMYFNGDQGFHGTYWHSNFGNRMSHGCVNLPLGTAEFLYSWAPNGTEVRVQA